MIAGVLASPSRIGQVNPHDHRAARNPKPGRPGKPSLIAPHAQRAPVGGARRRIHPERKKTSGVLPGLTRNRSETARRVRLSKTRNRALTARHHHLDETRSRAATARHNHLAETPPPHKPGTPKHYPLLLAVVINGYSTGKVSEFILKNGKLQALPKDLRAMGFELSPTVPIRPDGRIDLSAITGLTWHIDRSTQALFIRVPAKWLSPVFVKANSTSLPSLESGLGATLNYDVSGTRGSGITTGAGHFDLRGFSPWGELSSGYLAYFGAGPQGLGRNSVIRLDSTYTYDDANTLTRYRLGDFITGGLNSTRSVRLGGIQIGSNFAIRPDLITYPLPIVTGSVAVPSTVNVLVNGMQLLSQQVPLGPFQIPQIPVTTGAGTIVTTVTNALGQQVTTRLPFYVSSHLLAPGFQSFSASLGFVRLNWGLLSNDYGSLAASGSYRRGITDALTLEGHAEGSARLAMIGGGATFNVDDLGVVSLYAAGSQSGRLTGRQLSLGAQHNGHLFSVEASATFANPDFRDIASLNGDPVPTRQINAGLGLPLGRFGTVSINYAGIDSNAASTPTPIYLAPGSTSPSGATSSGEIYYFQPALHVHLLSTSYSRQWGPVTFLATAFRNLKNIKDTGLSVGLTIPLGTRSFFSATGNVNGGPASSNSSEQLQASQTPETVGQWGYRAYAQTGPGKNQQAFGQVQYKAPWALLSAGVAQINRYTQVQGDVRGALSYIDGRVFASNTIANSFALVDTNGFGHILVFDENRPIGRTNSDGLLLVPDLLAFNSNLISIDPNDVPLNATVPDIRQLVRPQYRSGIVVHFPIRSSSGALVRLVDQSGVPLPISSVATLQKTGAQALVGYEGEVYLVNLSRRNQVVVNKPDGRQCTARFSYHPEPGRIPTIGPIVCRAIMYAERNAHDTEIRLDRDSPSASKRG